jgi:membrane protein required for colicin V production
VLFDLVAGVVLAGGLLWGLLRGIVRITVAAFAWVAALLLASWFHRHLASVLVVTGLSLRVLRVGAYVGIFLAVLFVGGLVGFLLRKLVRAARLGFADRVAGAAVGVAAGSAVAAFLLVPLVAYAGGGTALAGSTLAPYVSVLSDVAAKFVPESLARDYRHSVRELRQRWAGPPEPPARGGR